MQHQESRGMVKPNDLIGLLRNSHKRIDPDDGIMKARPPQVMARYQKAAAKIRLIAHREARKAGYSEIVDQVIKERHSLSLETALRLLDVPRRFVEGMLYRHPIEVSRADPTIRPRLALSSADRFQQALLSRPPGNERFGDHKKNRTWYRKLGREWLRESDVKNFWANVLSYPNPEFRVRRQREYRLYQDMAAGRVPSEISLKRLKVDYGRNADPCITIIKRTGKCPLEMEGLLNGFEFHFRAQGNRWFIGVGGDPVSSPVWQESGPLKQSSHAYSMSDGEAGAYIAQAAECLRHWNVSPDTGPPSL